MLSCFNSPACCDHVQEACDLNWFLPLIFFARDESLTCAPTQAGVGGEMGVLLWLYWKAAPGGTASCVGGLCGNCYQLNGRLVCRFLCNWIELVWLVEIVSSVFYVKVFLK